MVNTVYALVCNLIANFGCDNETQIFETREDAKSAAEFIVRDAGDPTALVWSDWDERGRICDASNEEWYFQLRAIDSHDECMVNYFEQQREVSRRYRSLRGIPGDADTQLPEPLTAELREIMEIAMFQSGLSPYDRAAVTECFRSDARERLNDTISDDEVEKLYDWFACLLAVRESLCSSANAASAEARSER